MDGAGGSRVGEEELELGEEEGKRKEEGEVFLPLAELMVRGEGEGEERPTEPIHRPAMAVPVARYFLPAELIRCPCGSFELGKAVRHSAPVTVLVHDVEVVAKLW